MFNVDFVRLLNRTAYTYTRIYVYRGALNFRLHFFFLLVGFRRYFLFAENVPIQYYSRITTNEFNNLYTPVCRKEISAHIEF